jgi:hypothetical protein
MAGSGGTLLATLTDDERKKADELVANLEATVGQLNTRDIVLRPLIRKMIQELNALRSLLGIVRAH